MRHDKGETAIDVRSDKKGVDGVVAVAEARRAYVDVKDGDVFASVPGATLRALFTPGHTEDHVCFVLEEEGAIFAGDCVLNGNTAVFENLAQYSRSLETMRAELEKANASAEAEKANATTRRDDSRPRDPPVGRLYPSHGDVIRDGSKKLEQYARHRETREAMFLKTLVQHWRDRPARGGVTKRELTRSVYCDAGVSPLVLRTACGADRGAAPGKTRGGGAGDTRRQNDIRVVGPADRRLVFALRLRRDQVPAVGRRDGLATRSARRTRVATTTITRRDTIVP